jgi:hypothetical protein
MRYLDENSPEIGLFDFARHQALADGFRRGDRGRSQHVVGIQIEPSRPQRLDILSRLQ